MNAKPSVVNLAEKFDLFQEQWTPKIIAESNRQHTSDSDGSLPTFPILGSEADGQWVDDHDGPYSWRSASLGRIRMALMFGGSVATIQTPPTTASA